MYKYSFIKKIDHTYSEWRGLNGFGIERGQYRTYGRVWNIGDVIISEYPLDEMLRHLNKTSTSQKVDIKPDDLRVEIYPENIVRITERKIKSGIRRTGRFLIKDKDFQYIGEKFSVNHSGFNVSSSTHILLVGTKKEKEINSIEKRALIETLVNRGATVEFIFKYFLSPDPVLEKLAPVECSITHSYGENPFINVPGKTWKETSRDENNYSTSTLKRKPKFKLELTPQMRIKDAFEILANL